MLVLVEGGKAENPEKNKQQTLPSYDGGSGELKNRGIYKYYTTKLQTLREEKEDEEDRKIQ